jgi:Zn-dependent peptidase ImmA (M78 family)
MLRLARELRGLTQTTVAKASGIPQTRLSRIESGQLASDVDETKALATALSLPPEFLLEPGVPAAAPLFRKRAIRSVRTVVVLQARLNTAVLIAQRLLNAGIELDPPQAFPEPGQFAPDSPVHAATELRRAWRLPAGRVDDVTAVIESAAGIVLDVDFGTDDATAAFISTPGDERMWFLVNQRERSGDRIRLSLAHELGHAVLHRRLAASDEAEQELQAFRFAAALLLPADSFDPSVASNLTLTQARSLKHAYWVSMQAIIRAAYDRERISRDRYTSLFKQLSARGWRINEPVSVAREEPQLWPAVLRVHRAEHGYSDEELANIARVDVDTLSELFPAEFKPQGPRLRVVRSTTPTRALSDHT